MRSKLLLVALCGFSLASCAALKTDAVVKDANDQTGAGLTTFELEREKDKDGKPYIKYVRLRDGKEKDNVKAKIEMPNGLKASYEAAGVKAFPGQEIRGIVEKAFVEAGIAQTDSAAKAATDITNALKPLWSK